MRACEAQQSPWIVLRRRERAVLHYALMFFVVAIIAAVLGMRGIAGLSAEIGYVLVVVAVIFLIIAFVTGRSAPIR